MFSRRARLASFIAFACLFSLSGTGHEMPADARVTAFLVPAGKVLSLLVRLPLGAMGDIDYPTGRGNTVLVSQADPALRNAATLWLVPAIHLFENDRPLSVPRIAAIRMSLPSDRSFESWQAARAGMDMPRLEDGLGLYWSQQMLDVLLEYQIESDHSDLGVDLRVDRFGQSVTTGLRFIPPGRDTRAFVVHGNAGRITLDPGWEQAALRFVQEGVRHILRGTDHLLFLACLVIPFRRFRPLLAIVTAFTVAHSITLIASAVGFAPDTLWFPPLIETAIAASILYMALENIVGSNVGRRWVLSFAFGLVHGLGFSFGLREAMQFAGRHLAAALLAFNFGVEIGQVLVLLILVPALHWGLSRLPSERTGVIVLSALVAHQAWHWSVERWDTLARFPLPQPDILLAIGMMQVSAALLVVGGLVWAGSGALNRWLAERPGRPVIDALRRRGPGQ